MNDPDPTRTAPAHPPISSSSDMQPRDTLLQRGAFDPPAIPGTLGRLDRFEILRLLGEGGMGQVYLAREPRTDTQVAIKIMKPDAADDPREVHRFLTEARHMYRLAHPRILRVLEVSDRPAGPYYVMPFIAGGSLLAHGKPGETLPETEVISIARQVAEALAHAHSHGLIHRDLKPGNVLLDKDGNAYLTDFGLVRTLFNDSMVDASASHLEGTAPYMSPAVARGEAEDTRCDIYAFGALLYELLTGKPPYTGRTPQIILDQVLKGPPAPLREVNPKASPALVKIAEGCMARELRDRYASMGDVVADLARAAKGLAPLGQHTRGRPGPARLAALAAAALALVALAGVVVWHFGTSTPGTPSAVSGAPSSASDITLSTPGVQSPASGVPDQADAAVERSEPTALSPEPLASSPQPPASSSQPSAPLPETSIHDFACTAADGAVTIVKYTGDGGTVVIPAKVNGMPVTTIKDEAFQNRPDVTALHIPEGVIRLGTGALHGCSGLREIMIPASMGEIDPFTFIHCLALTAIHVDALNPNYSSTSDGVMLNKEKTRIVRYPTGRKGSYVIMPRITHIGDYAFAYNCELDTIIIPEGVEAVEGRSFQACTGLTRLHLPSSVTRFDSCNVHLCSNLLAISVDTANPSYVSDDDGVVYSKDRRTLVSFPKGRKGPYVVPAGTVSIASYSARNAMGLTRVEIPEGVRSIGQFAFNRCSNLEVVSLPSTVTHFGWYVFAHCSKLREVIMPERMTLLRRGIFYGCNNLKDIYFLADAPKLDSNCSPSAFGGSRTIYHRPGTKGWGKTFAGRPTAVWVPEANGMATNLPCPAFVVSEAEPKGDWEAALLEYETRYDSKGTDEFLRSTLRTKFRELRPKVTPNRDPAQAGTWNVKAYAIRQLDFHWTDADKQARHTQWKMADAEIEAIRASLTAFAERVWEFTAGSLRIDWSLEMIDTPLTRLDGDANAGFWPGVGACMPLLTTFKAGDADTVMVYARLRGGPDEPGTAVPIRFAGWASGITGATRGATFAGFALGGEGDQESPGERELRQWIDNVKWTLEEHQAYPHGLMHSPDGGRDEGERGGDYCYRRKPGEKGWMGYYRHLMTEHVTRRMWRELTVRKAPENAWIRQYVRQVAMLGPFSAEGKTDWGIHEAFLDESGVLPKLGEKVGKLEWKRIDSRNGYVIPIASNQPAPGKVCYLAFDVHSDKEQIVMVKAGSDNHSKLWHNGRLVLTVMQQGGMIIDQAEAPITLSLGKNRFLMKVADGGGDWEASIRFCATDGGPLEGVRYEVE